MHVIALHAENFKRLRAVDITTDPANPAVVISGANAQGKTSVLDAIWAALGGAKASPDEPIRHGEKKASVTVDLGDLKVTRTWKAGGGSSLTVTNAAGGHMPSPQSVLDKLVGRLAFDPLQFALADDKKQLATLLEVVELPFDPVALAAQRRALYDQRTDVNREVKRLEGALASMPRIPASTPEREVSVGELAQRLAERHQADRQVAYLSSEWQTVSARIAELQAELAQIERDGATAAAVVATMPTVDELQAQIDQSEQVNLAVRLKRQRAEVEADLGLARGKSEGWTEQIDNLDQRKAEAIAAAAMPVPGLGFDEDGVLLDGVRFSQASAAERLRVSTAIAMAKNPDVRVILIRDASLLDSSNLRIIAEMAAAKDFQVWMEKVDETGEVGIVIEDGSTVAH